MRVINRIAFASVMFLSWIPVLFGDVGIIEEVWNPSVIRMKCNGRDKPVVNSEIKGLRVVCKEGVNGVSVCKILSKESSLYNCIMESEIMPLEDNLVMKGEQVKMPKCLSSNNDIGATKGQLGATRCK